MNDTKKSERPSQGECGTFLDKDPHYHVCGRKKKFNRRKEANIYLSLRRKAGALGPDHRVYKCRFCKRWHVGQNNYKMKNDEKRRNLQSMTCMFCAQASGHSLICKPCRRRLNWKSGAYQRAMGAWHDMVCEKACTEDGYVCFHCENPFARNEVCGDHFPYTKGASPDLIFDLRNGVCCCKGCNLSGAKTRKNWREYVPLANAEKSD